MKKTNNIYFKCDFKQDLNLKFISIATLPTSNFIGKLNGCNLNDLIDINDVKSNDVKTIRLNFQPYNICNCFNEYLAITDYLSHKVHLLNKRFRLFKTISSIENSYFNLPRGICAADNHLSCDNDNTRNIYLCDSGNQRILITDENFTHIKRIIKNMQYLRVPHDICVNASLNSLFVLDMFTKEIVNFNLKGDYIRQFSLFSMPISSDFINEINMKTHCLIKKPLSVHFVGDNELAVNSNQEKILIYNSNDGHLEDTIESSNLIGTLFYSNGNLFVHQLDGSLVCYKKLQIKSDITTNTNVKWTILFERNVKNLVDCKNTNYLTEFNGHLVFSLTNKNLMVI